MLFKFSRRTFVNSYPPAKVNGVADFRSDTVTRPCPKMRDAIAMAVVGDEMYDDCPSTTKLEEDFAQLTGKEASIFTTSGTQANLIAMMLMATNRGECVIIGD